MTSIRTGEDGVPHLEFGDGMPFGHEVVAAAGTDEQRTTLTALRKSLKSLAVSQDEVDILRKKLIEESYETDRFYTDHGAQWQPDKWNIVSYLAGRTNAELIAFAKHNVAHQRLRQQELDESRVAIDAEVQLGLERLENSGLINARIASRYRQTIHRTEGLVASDAFDVPGLLAKGYCTKDGVISLKRPYVFSPAPADDSGLWESQNVANTTLHEYTHAVGVHYGSGFAFNEEKMILLEEVVASHWTAAALRCQQDSHTVIPQANSTYHAYFEERNLVGSLMRYAPVEVGVEQLRDAYFSTGRIQAIAVRGLHKALDASVDEVLPQMLNWNNVEALWGNTPPVRKAEVLVDMQKIVDRSVGANPWEENFMPETTEVFQLRDLTP